ncbi:Retrovirus-related Pol polyprotein from transposon TNT 1-94-like protein [Drosera capensis]
MQTMQEEIKRDANDKLVKRKVRLVVQGFGQKKGIDFDEIFSPVVKMTSMLGLAASMNLKIDQLDVKIIFLHGNLNEKIYMTHIEGFEVKGKEHLVCRLKKSFYGLKQASCQWYKKFDSLILNLGYIRNKADSCVYVRKFSRDKFIVLLLYVDDMLIIGHDVTMIEKLKQ